MEQDGEPHAGSSVARKQYSAPTLTTIDVGRETASGPTYCTCEDSQTFVAYTTTPS